MDSNFRRYKSRNSRTRTVDGFVGGNRGNAKDGRRVSQGLSGNYKPSGNKLGDFRRTDGFHASDNIQQGQRPASINSGRQPVRDPSGNIALGANKYGLNRRKKKRSWQKITLKTSVSLVLLVVITAGFLFGKAYWKARHIFKGGGSSALLADNVDPSKLRGEGDGRVNVLILGKGGPGHDGPDLTDTLLIASIDPIQKEAALLSIPRDLYVKTDDYGSMKINSLYATAKNKVLAGKRTSDQQNRAEDAGLSAIQDEVEQTMGIPIHYYVMVDFEAFRKGIDSVGGITIDVKQQVYDPTVAWENHNNPLIAGTGLQTFNGKRALLYARSRHGSARGDFDRTERQREVLLALKDKIISLGTFSNPVRINDLISAFGDHVRTNFNISEMLRLYQIGKDIPSSKVSSIGLADPPNDFVKTANMGGLSVVVPRAGLYDYSEIQNYVRNALKDGYIRNENANIIILNGTTTPGLATKKAEELKSYGYNVTLVDNAPTKDYQKTMLIDLRNGAKKYTRHYLEQRLHVTATTKLPDQNIIPGAADFVIILGDSA